LNGSMAKRVIVWLAAISGLLALTGGARAAFAGANGRIAYLRAGGPLVNDAALIARSRLRR
jgi:hypothetical protein